MKTTVIKIQRLVLGVVFLTSVFQVNAQGVLVNKTDGTTVRIPADDIVSITTYGFETKGIAYGHEYVDLGLPSGTLWATCNIGATKPEDYGDYYAWGETETKGMYSWDTYKYGRSNDDVDNIGSNIAGTKYDVAHVKWGGDWRMPTTKQFKELIDNTTSEFITRDGIMGQRFIGENGGTIFLPAAGYHKDSNLKGISENGNYWTSSLFDDLPSNGPIHLSFDEDSNCRLVRVKNIIPFWGLSVRPVR